MAAQWIFGQEMCDDSREPIEAFAHVGGLSAGVDLQMMNEADHDWRLAPQLDENLENRLKSHEIGRVVKYQAARQIDWRYNRILCSGAGRKGGVSCW